MLLGRITADQQNGRRAVNISHAGGATGFSREGGGQRREVSRAVMVNVVGLQNDACELLQQVIFLVGSTARPENADGLAPMTLQGFAEIPPHQLESFLPACRCELAIFADKRPGNALGAADKIKSITALDAEEVAVDAALIAVVTAHDFHAGIGAANP